MKQFFRFRSFRTKLQTAFVLLGLSAVAVTNWQASSIASSALEQATLDRLTALRQTRASQIEDYFRDIEADVAALSADESTINATEGFREAWAKLPGLEPDSPAAKALHALYDREFPQPFARDWYPADPRAQTLQSIFLAANPHPARERGLLLEVEAGRYGAAHNRFHPTFQGYRSAFGFHDIVLILAPEGRIVYTVRKEIDLGTSLHRDVMRTTGLARAYQRALAHNSSQTVLEDYAPYPPSGLLPAAFAATAIRRAGSVIGVLAIQVSIHEVNRVMTGDNGWRAEGLGETGQAYITGPDGLLRSDLRQEIEDPAEFYSQLEKARISPAVVERIRTGGTAVLTLPVMPELRGVPSLRSKAPLHLNELQWTIVAEIDSAEALAPIAELRRRTMTTGVLVSMVFFLAASLLAAAVTRPVLELAGWARRLGAGERGVCLPRGSSDEIGQLRDAFNRMSNDLQETMVSKKELELLAGRLITAQEEERRRIARELHDDLTQRLAALAIEAGRLERLSESPGERRAGLETLKREIGELATGMHGLSRRLHPALLDDLGLAAAIEAECRACVERGGPVVETDIAGAPCRISRDVRLAVYRIVQEALRNVLRHSGATEVNLRLSAGGAGLMLRIQDNGAGFDRGGPGWRPGLGLASMEERTRLLGGAFQVSSKPGEGTLIEVTLPMDSQDEQTENSPR
ncbi:MAG: HAMP domain-containing protein [Bryobacterales bacterium]|nr:HAMP domain-containing protein [Bryobacterales bacterium]